MDVTREVDAAGFERCGRVEDSHGVKHGSAAMSNRLR